MAKEGRKKSVKSTTQMYYLKWLVYALLWDPFSDKLSILTFLPTHKVVYSNDVQVYTLEIFMSELLKVFLILGYLCIKVSRKCTLFLEYHILITRMLPWYSRTQRSYSSPLTLLSFPLPNMQGTDLLLELIYSECLKARHRGRTCRYSQTFPPHINYF